MMQRPVGLRQRASIYLGTVDKTNIFDVVLRWQVLEYTDMPRASQETVEDVSVPKKRAPRKRVPKAEGETVPRPRVRRSTKKATEEVRVSAATTVTEEPEAPTRKAPTPLAAKKQNAKRSTKVLWGALIFAAILTTTGIMIGLSDSGQIDVVAVVNERNEKINRGEVRDEAGNPVTINVPVQNASNEPNGGLVPADPQDIPTPPPAVATTTEEIATTTDAVTASSTEDVTESSTDTATTTESSQ
jgi:hypothetical protein